MRHLYANFRKRFPGQKLKILMWKASRSTHPIAWEMKKIANETKNLNMT